jgi:uracil-DNA glycosylase
MTFKDRYSQFFEQLDSEQMEEERFVPAVGPEDSDFMLIGEAPELTRWRKQNLSSEEQETRWMIYSRI